MTRVLVFGTFDIFHKGHEYFLTQAKTFGDHLVVVIALDTTVERVKGKLPKHTQNERLAQVAAFDAVDEVVLGNIVDKYKIIEELKPDVIVLGYDQTHFVDNLQDELVARGLSVKIIRVDSHEPETYKSSLLRRV